MAPTWEGLETSCHAEDAHPALTSTFRFCRVPGKSRSITGNLVAGHFAKVEGRTAVLRFGLAGESTFQAGHWSMMVLPGALLPSGQTPKAPCVGAEGQTSGNRLRFPLRLFVRHPKGKCFPSNATRKAIISMACGVGQTCGTSWSVAAGSAMAPYLRGKTLRLPRSAERRTASDALLRVIQ